MTPIEQLRERIYDALASANYVGDAEITCYRVTLPSQGAREMWRLHIDLNEELMVTVIWHRVLGYAIWSDTPNGAVHGWALDMDEALACVLSLIDADLALLKKRGASV